MMYVSIYKVPITFELVYVVLPFLFCEEDFLIGLHVNENVSSSPFERERDDDHNFKTKHDVSTPPYTATTPPYRHQNISVNIWTNSPGARCTIPVESQFYNPIPMNTDEPIFLVSYGPGLGIMLGPELGNNLGFVLGWVN